MKFELEPENRGAPDAVLLDDLRTVAYQLAARYVSREQCDKLGRFHHKTLAKRFGSWNRALEKSGLEVRKPQMLSKEEVLADIKRVAEISGSASLTTEQYEQLGRYSVPPVQRLFGEWRHALAAAGLQTSSSYKKPLSQPELFENLERVWRALGRQPRQADLRDPISSLGHDIYCRRFGSWRKALEAFVEYMTQPQVRLDETAKSDDPAPETERVTTNDAEASGSRTAGWRLRFLVMRRDRFSCIHCGASPSSEPGTVLVIEHVVPWSKGGLTVFDNLQTLCEPCNGGKSNLAASAAFARADPHPQSRLAANRPVSSSASRPARPAGGVRSAQTLAS